MTGDVAESIELAENPRTRALGLTIFFALTAALVRLIPLQWLSPLNWDELEFYRATSWIAGGRVPFRDFWEHHTPLAWFLFAPITWLTKSPGVDAIVALRWAQIPIWIATFWLANLWMRNAGLGRFARWASMALALSSSMLMIPAVEYRVDSLACALFMAGLVLVQRRAHFLAGIAFCLCGFANLRFGPLLVVTVLLFRIVRDREWKGNRDANRIFAGGFTALAACLSYFVATGSLRALYQQVWAENLAEKYATPVVGGFVHRLLVPFGIRIMASDRLFELAAFDVGGVLMLLLGFVGLFHAIAEWRRPDDRVAMALLQLTNLLFIASMKFVYNYHFMLVIIMMIPLAASTIERIPRRALVVGLLTVAWSVNGFASVFRGKELDRAYQDLIMLQVDARTHPGDAVWSGIPWALRREAPYRFWFLPELARQLVLNRLAAPYRLEDVLRDPPAALVMDHNALVWLLAIQPRLSPYFAHHYIPVWRELWIPAMNARLTPGAAFVWIVPRDGEYHIYASPTLADHPWFRSPLGVTAFHAPSAARLTVELPKAGTSPELEWRIDRRPATLSDVVRLRKGQRIEVTSRATVPLAVIVLSSHDRILFRQPPPGATLEAETTRITHVPQIGARIEP